MPYPRELLNDDETIAVDLHPHWWFFAWPTALLAAGVFLAILSMTAWTSDIVTTVAIITLIVAAVWLGIRYLKWLTTNFVVTSDRVIYRSGVIGKSGIEIPLERVNTVFFNQGIFERAVGTGDLTIESAGVNGEQHFTDIYDPDRVQNTIHKQMDINDERRGGSARPHGDVAGQLEKFEGMLERGTITQDEFEAQKRRLLET